MALMQRLTWQSVIHNFFNNAAQARRYSNVQTDVLSLVRLQEFPIASSTYLPSPASVADLVTFGRLWRLTQLFSGSGDF